MLSDLRQSVTHSNLPIEDNGNILPQFVHDYLSHGAPQGERNETIYKVAQQFKAAGLDISNATSRIMTMAINQGGPKVENEVRLAIENGYRSSKVTEPIEAARKPAPRKQAPAPKASEARRDYSFMDALEAAFEPGETIAVVESRMNDDGAWKPSVATIKTIEKWRSWTAKMGDINRLFGSTDGGAYIAINPLKAGSTSRSNDNVSAYRHVLVEWEDDKHGLSITEQAAQFENSGLPISVMLLSGGRSVHAWVRVDAATREEWEARRDMLFAKFACDTKNKDVARVSRCPGAMRGDQEQKVLAIKLGASNWSEWVAKENRFPDIMSLVDFGEQDNHRPPALVEGVLFQGCKLLLCAPSKGRKSWTLIDLGLSVASGSPWLGCNTTRGKVLYINLELAGWMLKERIEKIVADRGTEYGIKAARNFDVWNLRGHAANFSSLIPMVVEKIKSTPYSLVIMDPLYKGLGDADENAAGDINALMNELESLCHQTGAALALAHHFTKGDPWDKDPQDRPSGSGVFARDPDALVLLTPGRSKRGGNDNRVGVVEEEDVGWLVYCEFVLRATAPMEGRWIRWGTSTFESATEGPKMVLKSRDGSMATEYGDTLKGMPPMKRVTTSDGKPSENCPVITWIASECNVDRIKAFRIWDTLRKPRYSILVSQAGEWRGIEAVNEAVSENPF